MPSVADEVRVVIDESSFDFHDLPASRLNLFLDQFSDTLQDLRQSGSSAWKPPMFAETPCLDGLELYTYILTRADRDVMLRFFSLLDKTLEWDAGYPICDEVQLSGKQAAMALSLCFAATAVISGHGVACLVFPGSQLRGFVDASSGIGRCKLFFFASVEDLVHFWRDLYHLEDIGERAFFDLTGRAFPNLIFHPGVAFRRFQGSYQERRSQVVEHLAGLNDHFLREYRTAAAAGRINDVEARLAAHGVGGVSAESVKTHKNLKAMRLREVDFNDSKVICEWHTKIRPEVDRIHFAFGAEFGDKILICAFVDHLPT